MPPTPDEEDLLFDEDGDLVDRPRGLSLPRLPSLREIRAIGPRAAGWASLLGLVFCMPRSSPVFRWAGCPFPRIAAAATSACLQTVGVPASARGDLVLLRKTDLPATPQSGFGMAAFGMICLGLALLTTRPWWERVVLVLIAIPIVMLVNVVRMVVSGALYEFGRQPAAQAVLGDLGGWLMFTLALGPLALVLLLLPIFRRPPAEIIEQLDAYDEDFFEEGHPSEAKPP